jgi:hypothetical protein
MTEPTKPKMTRKRALELAKESMQLRMLENYRRGRSNKNAKQDAEDLYAELAAALQVIENMARQQEMHL